MTVVRVTVFAGLTLALAACNVNEGPQTCGLGGCFVAPVLKAKLSPAIVGQSRAQALALAGTPNDTDPGSDGSTVLVWRQETHGGEFGTIRCTEKATVMDGLVTAYHREGNCSH